MLERKERQEWFYPPDFMASNLGDLFVGYEASARLSELAKEYPDMIESRPREKYKERRIRYEAINAWWEKLTPEIRDLFIAQNIIPNDYKKPTVHVI